MAIPDTLLHHLVNAGAFVDVILPYSTGPKPGAAFLGMANLSQDERLVVATYPLNDSLAHLQDSLRKAEQSYPPRNFSDVESVDNSATGPPKAISRLLSTLQGHEVAFGLRSKTRNGNIVSELSTLVGRVQNGDFNYEHYRVLSRLVIKEAPDVDIWNAVFDLISTHSRITPPPSRTSFTSSFQQTPWSFNTGSFADTSEHRNQVDGVLKEELLPGLRLDIPDFVPAVFGQIPRLDELAEEAFGKCQDGETPLYKQGSGWTKWPPSAKEELVLEWLQDLMKRLVVWVNHRDSRSIIHRHLYQGPTVYLDGSPIKRKMDVGITARHAQSKSEEDGIEEQSNTPISNWGEILMAGELKSNAVLDGQTPAWLDLATYAREVFRAQDRRFVLGFTLCGSLMRLWQFDRSGSSGSSSFDINEDGCRFVHVMLGYFLMNDKQLGRDPTIQQSIGKCYIEVTRDDQIERLFLTEEIRKQVAVAGRATTCWRAYCEGDDSKEPLVVKDSWQYEERPEEGELIKEATSKGVQNIARYYHHETVRIDGKNDDTIGNVRGGLMKTCGRTMFRQKSFNKPEAQISESLEKTIASRSQSRNQSPSPSRSQSRKQSPRQSPNQSRSNSRKRSSDSAPMAPPMTKRSCSSFRSPISMKTSHNRVHRRVITRDPGRPIYKASSRLALLTGFIGAISGECAGIRVNDDLLIVVGHESLLNAGILHRDVSIGNIMLTEKEDDGFLIDLDLAIKTGDDQASSAPSKTGTKIFMAIGALLGDPHTFMHDLESFFWAFFWICIHYGGLDKTDKVKRRVVPKYEKWNYADIGELAEWKKGVIDDESDFDGIMEQHFTAYFKPFAPYVRDLRKEVFPNNRRWKTEDHHLYSAMKAVMEKARKDFENPIYFK